jgi:hypothetical protein
MHATVILKHFLAGPSEMSVVVVIYPTNLQGLGAVEGGGPGGNFAGKVPCFSTSEHMTNARCGDKNRRKHRWGSPLRIQGVLQIARPAAVVP